MATDDKARFARELALKLIKASGVAEKDAVGRSEVDDGFTRAPVPSLGLPRPPPRPPKIGRR